MVGDQHPDDYNRLSIVLDLDDTLIHTKIMPESMLIAALEEEKKAKTESLELEQKKLNPKLRTKSNLLKKRKQSVRPALPGSYYPDEDILDIGDAPHLTGPHAFDKEVTSEKDSTQKKRVQFYYHMTFVIPEKPPQPALRIFVLFRPALAELIVELSQRYEPILFAAATEEYVDPIVDYIERYLIPPAEDAAHIDRSKIGYRPARFRYRLYRKHTVKWKQYQNVKDVRLLGRDLSKVVIVDDNPISMFPTPDNAVPVPRFKRLEDPNADGLLGLVKLLQDVTRVMNIPYGMHKAPMNDVRKALPPIVNFRHTAKLRDPSVQFDG
jgi:TFIIF-interacting CTD phosphatase-like protein